LVARYLITTADERTWVKDQPILFLGEWCRLYNRKHIWSKMDAIVAEPYGLNEGQKDRDLDYIYVLRDQLVKELASALNKYHNTDHSLRYWHILTGPWLNRFLMLVFNRFYTLEQALNRYNVCGTTVFESESYSLASPESFYLPDPCNDDIWNNFLFSRILKFIGHEKIEVNPVPLLTEKGFFLAGRPGGLQFNHNILNLPRKILPNFCRENDAFIINSYLRLKDEALLQLCLGQCPQFWKSPELDTVQPDKTQRQRFNIESDGCEGFELFVRLQLAESVPTCFLEGYGKLVLQAESLPWPKKPKFIFTSVNFNSDEIFKAWTASKVEQGIPYYTGQHGNNYGEGRFFRLEESSECLTSDRFITWGWTNGEPRNIPAYPFITANRKPRQKHSEGHLLLIDLLLASRSFPWDTHFEHGIYQEEQFRFVEALPPTLQQKLLVRLNPAFKNMRWFENQRWEDRSPRIKVETDAAPMHKLIARSRLVVNSYNSTIILECLALNIPTIGFWNGGLNHIMPKAKPYYELLRNVGILADTPEHAAGLVALHWEDVGSWWESEKVQDARKEFCEEYARTEKNPIRKLKRILTSVYC